MFLISATQQDISRFDTVCEKCSTPTNGAPDGVEMDNESGTPSCQKLPVGTVGRSSGTTVSSLTLQEGYYRISNNSVTILTCYRQESCVGGDDSDNYCAVGYGGPCESYTYTGNASLYMRVRNYSNRYMVGFYLTCRRFVSTETAQGICYNSGYVCA